MIRTDIRVQPYITLLIVFFFFGWLKNTEAQVIKGSLKELAGQKISLFGFDNYNTYEIGNAILDDTGNFVLSYPETYKGVGVVKAQDNSSLVLILTEEVVEMQGLHLNKSETILFEKSEVNKLFYELAASYQNRSEVYSAWHYLESKYNDSVELKRKSKVLKAIQAEMASIKEKNNSQLINLPKDSYLKWYMPKRKLLSDMFESMRRYKERIPQNILQFRTIDFTHENFKTSGLLKELIDGHYFLLENLGITFDDMYAEMNLSTDYLIENLKNKKGALNIVLMELFAIFEKRSLFPAATYLAERLLGEKEYALESIFEKKLKKYAKLKEGSTAPDIALGSDLKLSDLNKNVLLIFGVSTCPRCKRELQELRSVYNQWKGKLEIVYISLDEKKLEFEKTYKNTPWKTYCDFKGWNTKAAKDYAVLSTPTYILIDRNMQILKHPASLGQIYAWVQYKL